MTKAEQARIVAWQEVHTLMMVAMAATYDPTPSAPNGFKVPLDLETGEFIASRWKRWLAGTVLDPVRHPIMRALRCPLQRSGLR